MSGPVTYPEAPCSERLQKHLDAAADQALCIVQITRGEACEQ